MVMNKKLGSVLIKRMISVIIFLALAVNICCVSVNAAAQPDFVTIEGAMEQVRVAMAAREENFTIYVKSSVDLSAERAVPNVIFYPAMKEDGPIEGAAPRNLELSGDYLEKIWHGHSYRVKLLGPSLWKVDFIDVKYRTTMEEENAFLARLDEVMSELALAGLSDYEKCYKIYSYICSNVTYDDEAYEAHRSGDTESYAHSYLAYSALLDGKAVCSGYAHLFYAMCYNAGVPVRIVRGSAEGRNGWGAHAWNIVQIDGEWYQVDSTWDAGEQPSEWNYFLKGTKSFSRHKLGEDYSSNSFQAKYPLSSYSYIPKAMGQKVYKALEYSPFRHWLPKWIIPCA